MLCFLRTEKDGRCGVTLLCIVRYVIMYCTLCGYVLCVVGHLCCARLGIIAVEKSTKKRDYIVCFLISMLEVYVRGVLD